MNKLFIVLALFCSHRLASQKSLAVKKLRVSNSLKVKNITVAGARINMPGDNSDNTISAKKAVNSQVDSAVVSVSVIRFGANGNDLSSDSAAFQNAINYASANKRKLTIPAGNYYVGNVKLKSDLIVEGCQGAVLHKPFFADFSLGCGFDNVSDPAGANNVANVSISNIAFLGTSTTDGFYDYRHLLSLNGTFNISVTNCSFTAFNGDGIYIGTGLSVEKHNKKILIRSCHFDGINHENRNAISVIDVDGITIDLCDFKNCTKSNMPGAVDLEPDNYTYNSIKNAFIYNNTFDNVGGGVGVISCYSPLVAPTPVNIKIINNTIKGGRVVNRGIIVQQPREADAQSISNNVVIERNSLNNVGSPVFIFGLKSVKITKNTATNFKSPILIGASFNPTTYQCYDVQISENYFENNTADGVGVELARAKRVTIAGNTFKDIGLKDGSYGTAILGSTGGRSEQVHVIKNTFLGSNLKNISEVNPGHVTIASGNIFKPGYSDILRPNYFPFRKSSETHR